MQNSGHAGWDFYNHTGWWWNSWRLPGKISVYLQRSKLKLDSSTIRTLFLRGLTDNARNNLNLLGQGDISQQTFGQICELCKNFSRNQYRSGRGNRNKNWKTESTDAMIIGLENKMENMKIDIMNTITK